MKSNPSNAGEGLHYTQANWQTRPSIQDRLTIYNEAEKKADRRPICTIIHSDRISPEDLKLILAAPRLARALAQLTREERLYNEFPTDESAKRLDNALREAVEALIAAGIKP